MSKEKTNKIFDALLVLQCKSGNKKAMTLLVKRWHAKLCRQAYWYTDDLEASKDIVQDSWSTILLKINTLKDPNSFGSWALTIVTRNAIDWQRKRKKELGSLNTYQNDNAAIGELNDKEHKEEEINRLSALIKTLPKNQRAVLNLFYLEEYTVKQISEIMQVSVGTVKSRLFTAREKLKSILKNKQDEK